MSNYQRVLIFSKYTNLLDYYDHSQAIANDSAKKYYADERDVRLILLMRYERNMGKCKIMCKIKCPINPLPVKGEFEAPSLSAVIQFLTANGWYQTESFPMSMFE